MHFSIKNKGFVSFLLIAILLVSCMLVCAFTSHSSYTQSHANSREQVSLNEGWLHTTGVDMDSTDPACAKEDYDKKELKKWINVSVPHSWNSEDGDDGGSNYLRTVGWYRKNIEFDAVAKENKNVYMEFLGSAIVTTLYVNGVKVGTPHKGGYTAFRYDITNFLKDGTNLIAVKVDNRYNDTVAPLSGDFNFYGGIHRDVNLIYTDKVHVDMSDFASSGVYVTQKQVSSTSATIEIKANIVNDTKAEQTVSVEAVIKEPNDFTPVSTVAKPRFDVNKMTNTDAGNQVGAAIEEMKIPAGESKEFIKIITIENPHLWNGTADPFRYEINLSVDGSNISDLVTQYFGLRNFEVKLEGDKKTDGFYLNGKKYPLRGVNRHQDWENMAFAITKTQHDIDFGMIYEIGANSVRLAHYPHDPYFYELCDKYGLIVWAEIPLVDKISSDENFEEFKSVTLQMLEELIKQQYNRPSIMFWGLQNELNNGGRLNTPNAKDNAKKLMHELNILAHKIDPVRLTTQATNSELGYDWESDLISWNIYPNWYSPGSLSEYLDKYNYNYCTDVRCTDRKNCKDENHKNRPVGISEYGSGGNVNQHGYGDTYIKPTGQYHPEEFQTNNQKWNIKNIIESEYTWSTFVWNMFEFSSDWREEGDNPGINDKGIVTYDRSIKKDSFYAYKAWWNKDESVLHIDGRRYENQPAGNVPVTISSNCDEVELFITNPKGEKISLGKKKSSDADVGLFYCWDKVKIVKGYNKLEAVGINYDSNGEIAEYVFDTITWRVGKNTALILGLSLGLGIPAFLALCGVATYFGIRAIKNNKSKKTNNTTSCDNAIADSTNAPVKNEDIKEQKQTAATNQEENSEHALD